jgi:hypothetical protein
MCSFATAATVLSIASGVYSAYTTYQQSKAEAEVYDYQADVEKTNQALREDDRLLAMRRNIGTQTAQFGALGLNPLTGSSPLATAETAANTARDIFNDRFTSTAEQNALQMSASNTRAAGQTKAVGTLLNTAVSTVERYA